MKHHGAHNEYQRLEIFERMSYTDLNKKMDNYLAGSNIVRRPLLFLLRFYERITSKRMEEEISNTAYLFFYTLRDTAIFLQRKDLRGLLGIRTFEKNNMAKLKKMRAEPNSEETFGISSIINKIGIIRFLELEKEGTILRLNRKYGDSEKEQGINLLIKLLKDKYKVRTLSSKEIAK